MPGTESGQGSSLRQARFSAYSSAGGTPAGSIPNSGSVATEIFEMQHVEAHVSATA